MQRFAGMVHGLPPEFRTAPWRDRRGRVSALKAVCFVLLIYPAGWMLVHWQAGIWPALFPKALLTYWSGVWAMVVLLVTLAVTPIRKIFGWSRLMQIRRMLGVAALIYSAAHLVIYFWLRSWDAPFILNETLTRLSLLIATFALLGLIVLGATSLDHVIRRMGAARWARLHRWTYALTGLALLHFLLSPGSTSGLPFLMFGVYVWLMGWRWLAARGRGLGLAALCGLGVSTVLITVATEALLPFVLTGQSPSDALTLNFSLAAGLPALWSLTITVAAVPVALALSRVRDACLSH